MLIPEKIELTQTEKNCQEIIESLQEALNLRLRANVFTDYGNCEEQFKVSLWEQLNTICKIKHTVSNTFHPVDYILTSKKDNTRRIHLELKSRDAKHEKYPDFLIGSTKLKNIQINNLMPCILIWSFNKPSNRNCLEFSESNSIYFTEYSIDILKLPIKKLNVSGVVYIPKKDCDTTFERLIVFIKNYFNTEC